MHTGIDAGVSLHNFGLDFCFMLENTYTMFQKIQAPKLLAVTLSNLNRF